MKFKGNSTKFRPFNITFTFNKEEEAAAFYNLFSHIPIINAAFSYGNMIGAVHEAREYIRQSLTKETNFSEFEEALIYEMTKELKDRV